MSTKLSLLKADDHLGDLLRHPAFFGFAHLMLPWDDRAYNQSLRLRDIGTLLPYHNHVDPETVVKALNCIIDAVSKGKPVFFDFYSEAEKEEDPMKANTGLFMFRGTPCAPFALICPGGGFSYIASVHEGFPHAAEISAKGYNAFVLKYRAGVGSEGATSDLAAALSFVFHNATELGVSTAKYSVWGSSAGARMAAGIGSHGVAKFGVEDLPGPSAIVVAYTGHSDYSSAEPPTFVVVGDQDAISPPSAMERRVKALRASGTTIEYHKYRGLNHGFGPGSGTSAQGWISDAVRFWEKQMANDRDGGDGVDQRVSGREAGRGT